ncbi:MAG: hypothetical protein BGP12_03785 [Rhodospirillales bacterium 70-18]|nr:MAG: hypothetical protein BGP12_03785 [Rhodospirillales bacterium 70-18]
MLPDTFALLAAILGLTLAVGVAVAFGVARAAALAQRDAARVAEATATRLLRLTAHELRGIGMTLHGHADHLAATAEGPVAAVHAASLAAATAQLLGLADELQDHTMPPAAPRILREEAIELASAAREAIAAAEAMLAPGRRNWRLRPGRAGLALWADRRALRHVLARVLADAVRNTRNEDWIDIAIRPHPEGLEVVVEDEGAGLATPDAPAAALAESAADSRGIGLRLALARGLMEAHGGRLEVQAVARVGSSVSLVFPAARLRAVG